MIRYFVYRDADGTVSTVFKAEFDGESLKSQNYWDQKSQSWEKCDDVGQWYFVGNTDMDESTQQEVESTIAGWAS
jgi:hypothetical protein